MEKRKWIHEKQAEEISQKYKNLLHLRKEFEDKYLNDKKYRKVGDHHLCTGKYWGAAHSIYNLIYSLSKDTLAAFHNGLNYDYRFILKGLAEEFEKKFSCLVENTQKYKSLSVLIEREVKRIDRFREKITKTLSCRLKLLIV